jgi:hypothetical protein
MQGATGTDEASASIPTENERNGGRMSVRRKFTSLLEYFNPFSTTMSQQQLQQDDDKDTPARKRPRLETSTNISIHISTADDASDAEHDTFLDAQTYRYYMTDDADTALIASPDDTAAAAPTDTVTVAATIQASTSISTAEDADANTDSEAQTIDTVKTTSHDDTGTVCVAPTDTVTVTVTATSLPSDGASQSPFRSWKPEEDAKLAEAVKKHGKNWDAVAALVPGRSSVRCHAKWRYNLEKTIAHNKGKWTVKEDAKLTEAVKKHGKNWDAVAAL